MTIERGQIPATDADASENISGLGIPEEAAAELATQAELDALEAAVPAIAAARFVTVSVDGADETTPPGEIYAVVGIAAADIITQVLFLSTKAAVATIEVLDPDDFTPGADTITSLDEVDRTNDQLIVTYVDVA